MDPVYRNMHSYPHFYQNEHIPPQMHMHPSRPPVNYGCWPWGSNYGYAPPITCHGCFNHGYMPTHYPCGSPYPHVPPPYCPVNYPSFPAQYVPPTLFYGVEQPRYEYEKNYMSGGQHCCGCQNHSSHREEEKKVKIEEEENDGELRKSDSMVPLQFKNGPYPIVWFPPDYSDKKDGANAYESRKDVEKQPIVSKGWYPLDLSDMVSSKQKGDEERKIQEADDDGKGRFQFPLFWIPYKPEEKEMEKRKVNDSNTKPSLESEKGCHGEKNFHLIGDDIGGRAASKLKDFPVKKVEKHEEDKNSKNQERERDVKDRVDSGEKVDNGESKLSTESVKRKSSPSPPKSPKLPPVCLRVDPLPRRKSANGSSRSPSPPGDKQKPDLRSNEAGRVLNSLDNKKLDKVLTNESKEGKGTKTIEVVDGKTSQGKNMDVNMGKYKDDILINQPQGKPNEENMSRGKEGRENELKETSERKLSEEEAAVIIQSVYRGFDVRRWEPVKKLKEIAKVQEQIANVRSMIRAFESSSDIHDIGKQRNIISETIMSLLLKLDTIQGLHPSTRDVRKSVVKELVSLQEKVDAIKDQKAANPPEHESISKCADHALIKTEDTITSQNGNETPSDLPEADQNQPNGENSANSEGTEKLEKEDVKHEGEKSNEVLENVVKSTAKDDHEDPVTVQSSEPLDLQSSAKMSGFAPPDCDALDGELAELPLGVLDDIDPQECTSNTMVDADMKTTTCQEMQSEEGLIVEADEENKKHMEIHEAEEGNPTNESLNNCKLDNDIKIEDDKFEPEECVNQQPREEIVAIVEPSEASGDRELPIDTPQEKKMCSQLLREGNLEQKMNLTNESENACEPTDMVIAREMAEDKCEGDRADEQINGNLESNGFNSENAGGDEKSAVEDKMDITMSDEAKEMSIAKVDPTFDQVSLAKDDLTERNRKLMEENERLRGIMENLIKSGQEQLSAISCLTGRVKDLERKLSRNKKLKVKQHNSKKMRTLVPENDE